MVLMAGFGIAIAVLSAFGVDLIHFPIIGAPEILAWIFCYLIFTVRPAELLKLILVVHPCIIIAEFLFSSEWLVYKRL